MVLKDDNFIGIVDSYSQYLIDNQYRQIIAYYLSQLPSEIQIKQYAKFLQSRNLLFTLRDRYYLKQSKFI